MTVADLIEELKALPQGLEVWTTWDESGEYWPAENGKAFRVDDIAERTLLGRKMWRDAYPDGGKKVCVLQPPIQE